MDIRQDRLSTVQEALAKPQEFVSDHPVPSVFVVFGVGLGVGLVLGSLLADRPWHTPPSNTRMAVNMAEKLGRQVLDAINSVLPESLTKHCG